MELKNPHHVANILTTIPFQELWNLLTFLQDDLWPLSLEDFRECVDFLLLRDCTLFYFRLRLAPGESFLDLQKIYSTTRVWQFWRTGFLRPILNLSISNVISLTHTEGKVGDWQLWERYQGGFATQIEFEGPKVKSPQPHFHSILQSYWPLMNVSRPPCWL